MRIKIKEFICCAVYLIAFSAILLPTNYSLNEWQSWSLILGGFLLYCLGRYEGKDNLY